MKKLTTVVLTLAIAMLATTAFAEGTPVSIRKTLAYCKHEAVNATDIEKADGNGGYDISRQEYHYFLKERVKCNCVKEVVYSKYATTELSDEHINHVFAPANFDLDFNLSNGTHVRFYNTVFHSQVSLVNR